MEYARVHDIDQQNHYQDYGDQQRYEALLVRRKPFHVIIDYSHKR